VLLFLGGEVVDQQLLFSDFLAQGEKLFGVHRWGELRELLDQ
jgi:hypothetical protein